MILKRYNSDGVQSPDGEWVKYRDAAWLAEDLRQAEKGLEIAKKEIEELKKELALNANMLARQTDLAREAEIREMEAKCPH